MHATLCHDPATQLTRARSDIDEVIRTADGVLVVLNHHQGVALATERVQCIQKNLVIARMQPNRRLIKDVANALQITTQLCRESNPLCLPATECRCTTVKREVAQPDVMQKLQTRGDFRDQVSGNVGLTQSELQLGNPFL